MSEPHPTNRDPKDQRDPAHPPPEHEPAGVTEVDDQDAEPTMNTTDDVRPDGLEGSSSGEGGGAAPA